METAEIASLDDLIASVAEGDRQHVQRALGTAKIADDGAWAADGWVSMTAWMQQHCRLARGDAHRLMGDGRFLRRYPEVAQAVLDGRLSWSQACVIRRHVGGPFAELFDEHQAIVVESLEPLDLPSTTKAMQHWRERAEAVIDLPAPAVPDRSWQMSSLADGTVIGRFVFDKITAAQLEQALQTARTFDGDDDTRNLPQRDADAIADILGFFNGNHDRQGTPRHRPHIELSIEAHDILYPECDGTACTKHSTGDPQALFNEVFGGGSRATTASGTVLPQWATDAFACDSVVHRVLRAGSAVLDYGRATRSVPKNLFRAVACRDGGCRFPGCTRKVAWCDAHHIKWWRRYGATKLDNLLLLCGHHHRLVHRALWDITLHDDGSAEFRHRSGRVLTSEPRGRPTIRSPIRV